MLTVTERATVELEELLGASNAGSGEGVRLVPAGPGTVGMTIAAPEAEDEVICHGDDPLLT